MSKKLTIEIFIERANIVHNYKYLYYKSDYISSTEKIVITCKIHGDFSQTSGSHLQGAGCRKCHIENKNETSYKEQKVLFINKFKLKYGDYYDYSLFEYNGIDNESIFICPIHGKFYQSPYRHLNSKIGCFKCSVDYRVNKNRKLPIELSHYTNFQLLPIVYNQQIKRDKVFNRGDFEKWLKINYGE